LDILGDFPIFELSTDDDKRMVETDPFPDDGESALDPARVRTDWQVVDHPVD
jgi:hypothetical protein